MRRLNVSLLLALQLTVIACAHAPEASSSANPPPEGGPAPTANPSPMPVPRTFDEARKQCDGGDQQSCVVLAGFYWRGVGVERDPAKARGLIESACAAGNALGCDLKERYSHAGPAAAAEAPADAAPSPGMDPSPMLKQLCDAHDFNACAGLGTLYLKGAGVAADPDKAKQYLKLACDGGNANGCTLLHSMH